MTRSHADPIDTIAALATAPGIGGIAVIRLSGPQAVAVADRGLQGGRPLRDAESHTAHVRQFVGATGVVIDEVVATVFRSPRSYTGEDVVELSCHGGSQIAQEVLEALLAYGSRPAEPGEFTKRAFLNGKMDLAQAEAVADLIHARSEMARRASLDQLSGGLSRRIGALAGSPNVGKSSLLNALLNEDRAIVTDIPGTTRDVIEEAISIGGLRFVVSDTAGVRSTVDLVEQHGLERTERKIRNSDIVLLLIDASRDIEDHEIASVERVLREVKSTTSECIFVLNKCDLGETPKNIAKIEQISKKFPIIGISARTGFGLVNLEEAMVVAAKKGKMEIADSGMMVTNMRHKEALSRAIDSLKLARGALADGRSPEFVAVDLRAGLDSLGEIIGTTTTDDILNSIFSKFCIGK